MQLNSALQTQYIIVCPSVRLSVCPSVRLSVCPSVRLSVCPSVRLSVCPSVRLSPSKAVDVCHPMAALSIELLELGKAESNVSLQTTGSTLLEAKEPTDCLLGGNFVAHFRIQCWQTLKQLSEVNQSSKHWRQFHLGSADWPGMYLAASGVNLALLILPFYLQGCLLARCSSPELSTLKSHNWAIKSSVNSVFSLEGGDSLKLDEGKKGFTQVWESYSANQARAQLHFASWLSSSGLKLGSFYLDSSQPEPLLLMQNVSNQKCSVQQLESLAHLLNLKLLNQIELQDSKTSSYVRGPARLLHFIEERKDKLRMELLGKTVRIRNLVCLQYSYNYSPGYLSGPKQGRTGEQSRPESLNFTVFYSGTSLASNTNALPIRIIVRWAKATQTATIDFSQVHLLNDGHQDSVNNALELSWTTIGQEKSQQELIDQLRAQTHLDQFSLPLICLDALGSRHQVHLFGSSKMQQFSFKAKLTLTGFSHRPASWTLGNEASSPWVHFDSSLGSLRLARPDGRLYKLINYHTSRSYTSASTSKCLVQRINEASPCPTLSRVLAGAYSFVYLGQAMVRSISVRVYATLEAVIPGWIERPVEYRDLNGQTRTRIPWKGAEPTNDNLTEKIMSLIYVANGKHLDSSDDSQPILPLLIEVRMGRQILIAQLFQFSWELQSVEGSQQSIDKLFSLVELCPLTGSIKTAVELQMKSENDHWSNSLLKVSPLLLQRALLVFSQEVLSLPISQVYELDIRINRGYLFTSFRVAEHQNLITQLQYLGRVDDNQLFQGKLEINRARSFEICLEEAINKGLGDYLAYDKYSRLCFIGLKQIKESRPESGQQIDEFTLPTTNELDLRPELYKLIQTKESLLMYDGRHATWLESSASLILKRKILGRTIVLPNFEYNKNSSQPEWYWFQIKRIHVEPVKGSSPSSLHTSNGDLKMDSFPGLALCSGNHSRQVLAPNPDQWSTVKVKQDSWMSIEVGLTFALCRSACFSDLQCQSYSVCQRTNQLQCWISTLDFRSASVARQLSSFDLKKATSVQVTLDDGTKVELTVRDNCELYNKLSLDQFELLGSNLQSLAKRQLNQVVDREQCAQLCVQNNLQVISKDASFTSRLDSMLASSESSDQVKHLLDERRQSSQLLCRAFLYFSRDQLSSELSSTITDLPDRQSGQANAELTYDGYCVLDQAKSSDNKSSVTNQVILREPINLERYSFRMESLYERRRGIRLKASKMSKQVEAIYHEARSSRGQLNESSYLLMQDLIQSGHNFQEKRFGNEAKCAAACFLSSLTDESAGPWPSCSSFDIHHDLKTNLITCYLNSVTLQQAISKQRFDILLRENFDQMEYAMHFEPSFAMYQADKDGLVELASKYISLTKLGHLLNSWIIFILIVSGIVSGTLLGIIAGNQVKFRIATKPTQTDTARIIDIRFRNQVDASGIVK